MNVIDSRIRDVKFGENVKVVMPVNLYECELGDEPPRVSWRVFYL
ncbi:hypothetical protein [Escherichia coli]